MILVLYPWATESSLYGGWVLLDHGSLNSGRQVFELSHLSSASHECGVRDQWKPDYESLTIWECRSAVPMSTGVSLVREHHWGPVITIGRMLGGGLYSPTIWIHDFYGVWPPGILQ